MVKEKTNFLAQEVWKIFKNSFTNTAYLKTNCKSTRKPWSVSTHLMYLSMNFLWNSERSESLIKVFSFLSGSALAQFLNTTSSSQRLLTFKSDFSDPEAAYLSLNKGFPVKIFSIRILSSSCCRFSSWKILLHWWRIVKYIHVWIIQSEMYLQLNFGRK